jgi:putative ABC transport system ATP-binding protein
MAAVVSLAAGVPLIRLSHVSKHYGTGEGIVHAMRDVDLTIQQGEFVAIIGASGSGKSTMMNVLGCLDRPSRGSYELAGIDVADKHGDARAVVRNRVVGFVFQGFNLLPRTTALENVELPLQYRGVGARDRRRRATAVLEAVGLGSRAHHTQNQLSGGQQQRVAIARALVTDPPLLLADEPTGNLDTRTSLDVLALLQRLNRDLGITVVLVTHEREIAECASRIIEMRDGRIVGDTHLREPVDAAAALARLPPIHDAVRDPEIEVAIKERSATPSVSRRAIPLSVFVVMWVGEVCGELAAMAYLSFILRVHASTTLWVGAIFGEVIKAWAGALWARRALGRRVTSDERWEMAFRYTIGVSGLGLALATALAMRSRSSEALHLYSLLDWTAGLLAHGKLTLLAVVAAAFAGIVVVRYALLWALSARR